MKEEAKLLADLRIRVGNVDPVVCDRVASALRTIANDDHVVARWTRELLRAEYAAHLMDFRPYPDAELRKGLTVVAARASKLQDALVRLPIDLPMGEQWYFDLLDALPKLIESADEQLAELTRKRGCERGWKGGGRPPANGAKHVAEVAGAAFFAIRTKRPGRSVVHDVRTGKSSEKGDFLKFLGDVFDALGRTEKAANLARHAASILAHRSHRGVD
jgi:hypothetical protein